MVLSDGYESHGFIDIFFWGVVGTHPLIFPDDRGTSTCGGQVLKGRRHIGISLTWTLDMIRDPGRSRWIVQRELSPLASSVSVLSNPTDDVAMGDLDLRFESANR